MASSPNNPLKRRLDVSDETAAGQDVFRQDESVSDGLSPANATNKRPRRTSDVSSTNHGEPAPDQSKTNSYASREETHFSGFDTSGCARVHAGHNFSTYNAPVFQYTGVEDSAGAGLHAKKQYIELLHFPEMNKRYEEVEESYGKTCSWLLEKREWNDWRDTSKLPRHHGFLWIKGKAGAGKSTIMRYALANAQKKYQDNIVLHYFFWAQGKDDLEKSVCGMLRTLLYQLFEKLPETIVDTLPPPHHKLRDMREGALKDLLLLIVEKLGERSVTCFVDALDECKQDEIEGMVRYFEGLGNRAAGSNVRLYICFSSRPWPQITMPAAVVELALDAQTEHNADIKKYIGGKLNIGKGKQVPKIKAEIARRAEHVFLWVFLVIGILNEEYKKGEVRNLQTRLDVIPDELEGLFETIIHKDNRNTETDTVVFTLQWILYAKQPLTCKELYFAILSQRRPQDTNGTDEKAMQAFILHHSKGLAEVTKGRRKTVQFIHESVRQFLSSSKGLPKSQARLASNLAGVSHDDLKNCCERYLSVKPVCLIEQSSDDVQALCSGDHVQCNSRLPEQYPFLHHAIIALLFHANSAAEWGRSQQDFLKNVNFDQWLALNEYAEGPFKGSPQSDLFETVPRTYVFAKLCLNSLLRCELDSNEAAYCSLPLPQGSNSVATPLAAAISSGNKDGVDILLARDVDPAINSVQKRAAFDLALKKGDLGIVSALLQNEEGEDIDTATSNRRLYSAAIEGREEIVRVLLQRTSDIDATDGFGANWSGWYGSALEAACAKGHRNIVKQLLEAGAKVDGPKGKPNRSHYDTPLTAAVARGHREIVELLIERSPAYNGYSAYPFHAAIFTGRTEIAKLLIQNRFDIDRKGRRLGTALHTMIIADNREMIEFLIDQGADVNANSDHLGTPLHVASAKDNTQIAELLLYHNADPESTHKDFGKPLHVASRLGHTGMVKLLLERTRNANVGDSMYSTALCAAAYHGYEDVVRILLANGAHKDQVPSRTNGASYTEEKLPEWLQKLDKDNCMTFNQPQRGSMCGGTALQEASRSGRKAVVELLLRRRVDVNARSSQGGTALQQASSNGHESIVRLLLRERADPNAAKGREHTPLRSASEYGHKSIVKLLLNSGARVDATSGWSKSRALVSARRKGHHGTAQMLIESGAKRDAHAKRQSRVLDHSSIFR